jgi:predicted 3-demethylubiquinone-9 3-methyltransferase (glyoxalase superfamily)
MRTGRRTRTLARLPELLGDPDRERAQRVMAAMLKMRKIEIRELEAAAAG